MFVEGLAYGPFYFLIVSRGMHKRKDGGRGMGRLEGLNKRQAKSQETRIKKRQAKTRPLRVSQTRPECIILLVQEHKSLAQGSSPWKIITAFSSRDDLGISLSDDGRCRRKVTGVVKEGACCFCHAGRWKAQLKITEEI